LGRSENALRADYAIDNDAGEDSEDFLSFSAFTVVVLRIDFFSFRTNKSRSRTPAAVS